MRTLTLARMGRALMIAAAMIMLPQLASAQLAVTSKTFVMQDADAGETITLAPASAVTTSYTLTFPAAVGAQGSFLYGSNATGTLAWSDAPTGDGFYPRWEADPDGNPATSDGRVVWTDPAGADNPNWSLTGNALTAAGSLGTTTDQAVNFITGASGPNVRMSIAANGEVSIGTDGDDGENVTIGRTAKTLTVNSGTVDINGATTIDGATIGLTGATTQTGNFNLGGATSELQLDGLAGTAGDVLVSAGAGATPVWKSLNDATGIKQIGKVAIAGDASLNQTVPVTGMLAGDAVLITLQTTTGVYAVVTATAADQFTVQYSGSATGSLVYMVMDTTP